MPQFAHIRSWLPLAVLLVALASAIALGGDREYLYRWQWIHNQLTAKNLAVAENMSPKHNFRLALRAWRDEDGGSEYELYGRFPIGGYALIKLAMLPFGDGLSAKLLAARALMLLMFCGAAIFAYLAIARIAGNRWIALAATLLAFSSLYPLYFADSVAGETVMDLFGIALVFHGMVLFVQEGRFRQLLLKACAALLLGWHVYALILPFALLGFGGEALKLVRANAGARGGAWGGIQAAATLPALARSRLVALAAGSILFGSAMLAINFASEYAAYGGSRSFQNLPSVDSMTRRLGLNDRYENDPQTEPGDFLRRQLNRAGVASAPYAVAELGGLRIPDEERESPSSAWAAWGVAAAIAALAAALAVPRRFRLPMVSLALTGFIWAFAARNSVFQATHSFEGLFYVGLPLALWSGALVGARRLLGGRGGGAVAIGAAALAASVFALSALCAARISSDEHAAIRAKEIMADMDAIRKFTDGKNVVLSVDAHRMVNYYGDSWHAVDYYLAGSYRWKGAGLDLRRGEEAAWTRTWRDGQSVIGLDIRDADAEYAVIRYRDESVSLTPDNRHLFLYESGDLAAALGAERRRLESSEPAARSVFNVHVAGSALRYLKSPCAPEDADAFFFAHFFPAGDIDQRGRGVSTAMHGGDFPPVRFGGGFDGVNFPFASSGVYFADACMATANLPAYPISAIRTGQYISDSAEGAARGGEAWEVVISPPPSAETLAAYESAYQAVADGGAPAARSGFNLYLDADADTLTYLKQPCSEEDARGRFFLSVHPADAADLPAERREIGHESLNFSFDPPHGAVFNGKCMATRQLPDYTIERIETGQDAPGGGRLWDAAVEVGD